jgi:hypothetical protein
MAAATAHSLSLAPAGSALAPTSAHSLSLAPGTSALAPGLSGALASTEAAPAALSGLLASLVLGDGGVLHAERVELSLEAIHMRRAVGDLALRRVLQFGDTQFEATDLKLLLEVVRLFEHGELIGG